MRCVECSTRAHESAVTGLVVRLLERAAKNLDDGAGRRLDDRDHIEATRSTSETAPERVHASRARDAPTLLERDGLGRRAEPRALPPLDLHEADDAFLFRDEIDLAETRTEVAIADRVPRGLELPLREPLPALTHAARAPVAARTEAIEDGHVY